MSEYEGKLYTRKELEQAVKEAEQKLMEAMLNNVTESNQILIKNIRDGYENITIPQSIKQAERRLIEEIENQRDKVCCVGEATTLCHLADPCCSFMRESCTWWQQLKQKRGIE